jgi:hypothetical protein
LDARLGWQTKAVETHPEALERQSIELIHDARAVVTDLLAGAIAMLYAQVFAQGRFVNSEVLIPISAFCGTFQGIQAMLEIHIASLCL